MATKFAKQKVYADKNGNLVPEGDPSAAILVAGAGQKVQESAIEKYRNNPKFFVDSLITRGKDKNPLPDSFQPENLLDTVSKLSGPGVARLRSLINGGIGIRLQSTGDAANGEQEHILLQTLGVTPANPFVVTINQHILDPFTGEDGEFDLIERDLLRRVFDGASAGGTPILSSETMNWQPEDEGKIIRVGRLPGRQYVILSVEDEEHVTLSSNITLPSIDLTLTMDGEAEATIGGADGLVNGITNSEGWSRLEKIITTDKLYRVNFVPGDTGDGIYSIQARSLN